MFCLQVSDHVSCYTSQTGKLSYPLFNIMHSYSVVPLSRLLNEPELAVDVEKKFIFFYLSHLMLAIISTFTIPISFTGGHIAFTTVFS